MGVDLLDACGIDRPVVALVAPVVDPERDACGVDRGVDG